jgi:hypothetical protein
MSWGGGHGRHIAPCSGHVVVPNMTKDSPFGVSLAKKEWNNQYCIMTFCSFKSVAKHLGLFPSWKVKPHHLASTSHPNVQAWLDNGLVMIYWWVEIWRAHLFAFEERLLGDGSEASPLATISAQCLHRWLQDWAREKLWRSSHCREIIVFTLW